MGIIEFGEERISFDLKEEQDLLSVLSSLGIELDAACGGEGICKRCRVYIKQGRFLYGTRLVEKSALMPLEEYLACKVRLLPSSFYIKVPLSSVVFSGREAILSGFNRDLVYRRLHKSSFPTYLSFGLRPQIFYNEDAKIIKGNNSIFDILSSYLERYYSIALTSAEVSALNDLARCLEGDEWIIVTLRYLPYLGWELLSAERKVYSLGRDKIAVQPDSDDKGSGDLADFKDATDIKRNTAGADIADIANTTDKGEDKDDKDGIGIERHPDVVSTNTSSANIEGRREGLYGLAVDLGTTTVVAALVDLASKEILRTASAYNKQIRYGSDILRRISKATRPSDLKVLKDLASSTVNLLIKSLLRDHPSATGKIRKVVVSANTTMWHTLLGLDPTGIGRYPFLPALRRPFSVNASFLGLDLSQDVLVDIIPSVSSFVGGDITGQIALLDLIDRKEKSLFIDMGTNGEIVLAAGERFLASSCAMGPAFEGVGLSSGMRAGSGAINHIELLEDGRCRYSIIGPATTPEGICGSGYIDFISSAFKMGIINSAGRFNRTLSIQALRVSEEGLLEYVIEGKINELKPDDNCDGGIRDRDNPKKGRSGIGTDDDSDFAKDSSILQDRRYKKELQKDIVISERDIEQILKAKAALQSAVRMLLKVSGIDKDELDVVYLSGGFANYIDIENAKHIGLLPSLPTDRFRVIGNGSLAAAVYAMLDFRSWQEFERIIDTVKVVDLNLIDGFEEEYTRNLFIPYLKDL